MSGSAEDISLSECAASEIAAEPARKQRSGSDIAVSEQDDVLSGDTVRPIKYGRELSLKLGRGAQVPDIVAADADDDEIVACTPDRLQGREEITDPGSVCRAVMNRNLRYIAGELAGEGVFRSISTGADSSAIPKDKYFFERVSMLY